MSRKKNPTSEMNVAEKQSSILAQRLDLLITDANSLKDFLGVSIQAINQYRLGISRPSLENLCKISKFYRVTTDYLLGLDNDPTPDLDIKAVRKYTGLSSGAIEMIVFSHSQKRIQDIFEIEDFLIKECYLSFFATQIRNCVKNIAEMQALKEKLGESIVADHTRFSKWRAVHCFEESLDRAIQEFSSQYNETHPIDQKEYLAARKKEYTDILEQIKLAEQEQSESDSITGCDSHAVHSEEGN